MRKRVFAFFCVIMLHVSLWGQETRRREQPERRITIEECQQWAMDNYPAIRQHSLLEQSREYTLSNISRVYMPEFSFSGVASWQSEKMELDLKMPDRVNVSVDLNEVAQRQDLDLPTVNAPVAIPPMTIPVSDRDRYSASLSLKQALWTGGRMKAGKEIANREIDMMHAGLDVQLYEIKDRVKQLYFGLLTIEGREKQLDRADEILDSLRVRAEVALKEGVIYETDLDVIDVERIKYEQSRVELEAKREACLNVLSTLIGRPLSKETELQVPLVEVPGGNEEVKRPELSYLDSKIKRLDADLKMQNAEIMPKIGLFAMGGYGKSGLNTFDSDFKPYFIGGVMVSWNFGKLNTRGNDRKLIQVQQESVRNQRESFIFNTKMEVLMQDSEIRKLQELLKSDEETVRLRESIRKASEVKYANGVYTISELIADVNQALIARQEKVLREVELKMMVYTKRLTIGEF
ncbi:MULTISPECIES: TolC family protein [Butyricimonas]|uniref:TolC family protein n=1 Tax=Butyricimonas TaxID=574697 RepID=UPI001E4507C7|nr:MULTISPECIES: TolC family protein [Butyricimonas]